MAWPVGECHSDEAALGFAGEGFMKLLFTGTGGLGSWTMRGEQMAATRDAWKAVPDATDDDLQHIDAVVIVKRVSDECLRRIKAWGGPIIYDALDFWPQGKRGTDFDWSHHNMISSADQIFRRIDPYLILCPTKAMANDIRLLGWKTEVLYHHYDPRLKNNPVSVRRKTVVYHGAREHLGWWKNAIRLSCIIHGARLTFSNGSQPAPANVMIAVRSERPYLSRRWKSNVKAAIALKLGLPFVAWPEAGYVETYPSAFWFTNIIGMHRSLGRALMTTLQTPDESFSISACADRLEKIVQEMLCERHSIRSI